VKRWAVITLVASLVVNVFLLGLIAGSVWHWTHDRGMGFRGGWRMRVAESLPQPQGDKLRATIRATVQPNIPQLKAARADRAEAARLFVQPQFDANAIILRLDRARATDMALRANLERSIVRFAATLPQDQRQKMAEALKDGPFREGRPHGDGRPPHPDGPPPDGPPPQ
jgi:uncharacterized membrane protein